MCSDKIPPLRNCDGTLTALPLLLETTKSITLVDTPGLLRWTGYGLRYQCGQFTCVLTGYLLNQLSN